MTKKEERDLRKWLQSPAHNQREDIVELFDYLTAADHLENEKFLDRERVFRKIFPGEAHDDAKLRQTMHFLLKAAEEFLVYQHLVRDEVRTQLVLTEVYRRKNLPKACEKAIRTTESYQEKSSYRNTRHLENAYLLEEEKYRFLITNKRRTMQLNLQEVSDTLDLAYLSGKLRQCCILLSHQAVYEAGYRIGLIDEVLAFVEIKNLQDIPAVGIWYLIYKASTNPGEPKYFAELKEKIGRFGHLFPPEELRDIYLLANNYCIAKVNRGQKHYVREIFELNRKGIEHEVFLENGVLGRYTFRNIVTAGLTLREFDWVSWFIENYQDYLEPKHRENFVHFALSSLYFEKKDYTRARQLLMHFEYTDILINLQAKSMLIRMYYEEGELDALESLLDSMRTYIHRKEVIAYHRNIYNNLIRYTRKLVRLNPYNKAQREKLQKEIEEARQLRERQWFLQQLEAI